MRVVAFTLMIMAATTTPSSSAPGGPDSLAYASPEALRRYAQGLLMEEQGRQVDALGEYYRALTLDPGSIAIALRASELSARSGDHARALEFADRALKAKPGLPRALWLRGAALFGQGRPGEALDPLLAAARADSTRLEYLHTLARVAEHVERIDLVNWAYHRAVEVDDFDGEMWFQYAASEARLGRFAVADTALSRALELNPLRPGAGFLMGWIKESRGEPDAAIEAYRAHLEAHGSDQTTRGRLLGILMREARWKEAYTEARRLSRDQPGEPEPLEILADAGFRSGEGPAARDALALLERIDPDTPEIVGRIVTVYARNGFERDADVTLERWLLRHPGDFRGAIAAAELLTIRGDPVPALRYAKRAVEIAPDSLGPRLVLGQIHQRAERYAEASAVWREVSTRFPDFNPGAFGLAFCLEQLGDLAGAEAAVRRVLAREPDNADALNFLGYMFADHDMHLDEAARMIQRALEQEPDNGAFVDSMGWVYYRLGRLDDARRLLERAVVLTGEDPVVREHLGDVYKDLKLNELAREQYRLSLAGDKANARVRDKLRSMETR
jgi:tetratricopeptide (TPR) repeat protein